MEHASILQLLAENLSSAFNNTIFSHPGNMGDSREKAVIDYLSKVMPHKYGFQSGEIFDEEGQRSGQVDLIIYDNLFSTIFTDGTDKILAPVESTYGIISVKSIMGTKELDNAIKGIKTYEGLKRPIPEEGVVYIQPDFTLTGTKNNLSFTGTKQQNINCIFAFDTNVASKTIKERIQEAGCVDLLVVPGKLCAIGRYRSEFNLNQNNHPLSNYILSSEKSIAIFVCFLQLYLRGNRLVAGDTQKIINLLLKESAKII